MLFAHGSKAFDFSPEAFAFFLAGLTQRGRPFTFFVPGFGHRPEPCVFFPTGVGRKAAGFTLRAKPVPQ